MLVPEGTVLNSSDRTPAGPRPVTVLAMGGEIHHTLLAGGALDRLGHIAAVDTSLLVTDYAAADPALLAGTEVLFTHWGSPQLTDEALRLMPRLRAVVHAAGSIKHHVTEAVWERGIAVSSAAAANALPVAEFTLAAILFTNKGSSAPRGATARHGAPSTSSRTSPGRATICAPSESWAPHGSADG